MASGHANRANRPNTWLHRPMLHTLKKPLLTWSRPHMALSRHAAGLTQGPLSANGGHFAAFQAISPEPFQVVAAMRLIVHY